MKKHLRMAGYLIVELCDLKSGLSTTNARKDIPSFFYLTGGSQGKTIIDVMSEVSRMINMGCLPVALLILDSDSDECSLWASQSLPEWLRSLVLSCRCSGLTGWHFF